MHVYATYVWIAVVSEIMIDHEDDRHSNFFQHFTHLIRCEENRMSTIILSHSGDITSSKGHASAQTINALQSGHSINV